MTKLYHQSRSIHMQRNPGCAVANSVPAFTYASRPSVTRQPAGVLVEIGYMRYLALMPFPAISIAHKSMSLSPPEHLLSGLQRCHPTTGVLRCNSGRTVLEGFVVLPDLHAVYHLHQRVHVPFFLRPLKDDVGHKGAVQEGFSL